MLVLAIGLAVVIVAFILWIMLSSLRPNPVAADAIEARPAVHVTTLAYIADGKLFIRHNTGNTEQIESQYVRETNARVEREKKLAGWKEGTTWSTSFAQMRGMGEKGEEGEIRFHSVARLNETTLLYFLKSFNFGGLFKYDTLLNKEVRILHRQNLCYQDLSAANEAGLVLFANVQSGGNSHIAMIDTEGNHYRELTGGDTIDCAPAWVKGQKDQVVYQSQGLARDPSGYIKGVGPASIHLLNTVNGDLQTILRRQI